MSELRKNINKKQILIWVISVLPLVITAACYGRLPARIPTSWGMDGSVEYGARSNIWMMSGMAPLFGVMFFVLPVIDPKRRNYDKFQGVYQSFQLFMQIFLLVMTGIILIESFRPGTIQVTTVTCAMCSLLFMVVGNMMPKFRQNFFCGIKTPWALSSELVWTKTHRLGGRMWLAAGFLGLIGAFLPDDRWKSVMLFVPMMVASIIPGVMSYVWYRKLTEGKNLD